MRVINLASGSKGNCTLVEGRDSAILLDCGLDLVKVEELLQSVGCSPNKVKSIIVSHTHADHIKSVVKFSAKYNAKVYATDKNWQEGKMQKVPLDRRQFISFEDFYIDEFTISPFEVSHDAISTIGLSILSAGRKFSIVTDIGVMTAEILEKMAKSDLVFIESNYDEYMLRTGSYPPVIKKRILSKCGHLSNVDCAAAIARLIGLGTKHFVLMHISENNNTYELAYGTTVNVLKNKNLDKNIFVGVAFQHKVSSNFVLKEIL